MAELNRDCKWFSEESSADAAASLLNRADRAEKENSPRATVAWRNQQLFEGLSMQDMPVATDARSGRRLQPVERPIVRNRARSIIMTWLSKVAANDSPLPQFMTTDANWDTRRKAVQWDRAVEAEILQPHGVFADAHELWRHIALTAAIVGTGCVYYGLGPDGLPCAEPANTLDMAVDSPTPHAPPRAVVWRRRLDADTAAALWPKHEERIRACEDSAGDTTEMALYGRDVKRAGVEVTCGWALGVGRKKNGDPLPGRYMAVLSDGTVLADEDYERSELPFIFYHFEREVGGQWGTPMMQSLYWSTIRENEMLTDAHTAERNTPQVVVLAHPSQVAPGSLDASRAVQMIELTDAGMAQPPVFATTPKYNPQTLQLAQLEAEQAYEISGVSQANAGARKAAGTGSGRHEALVAALFTERFADHERRLIHARTVSAARRYVWCIQDAIDGGAQYSRKNKGREIDADMLDFELDYQIQIKPVSEDKNSPASRMRDLEEFFQAGQISGSDFIAGMQHLDSIALGELATARGTWIDDQIERWLYDDDPVKAYQSPVRWIDPAAACEQVATAYLKARSDGAPPERLELFENFMAECQVYIDQEKLQHAASQSPSAVGPQGLAAAFPGAMAPPTGAPALATSPAVPV